MHWIRYGSGGTTVSSELDAATFAILAPELEANEDVYGVLEQVEVRRFRFVSWTYVGVALVVPIPVVLIGLLALSEIPWLSLFLIGLPLAIALAMARRGLVWIALDGDRLRVRRGLWPARTIALPAAANDNADPYRDDDDVPRAPAVRLEAGDHADFELRNPTSRGLFAFTKVVRALFRVMATNAVQRGMGSAVEVDEAMTELSLRDADGHVHRFVVPAQGERNAANLEALAEALQATGHRPIGAPTR